MISWRPLGNLAEFYRAQGRYAEAEPHDQRALPIREKALRPEHPDLARSSVSCTKKAPLGYVIVPP